MQELDTKLQLPPGNPREFHSHPFGAGGRGAAFEPYPREACILLVVHLQWHVTHAMFTFISCFARESYFIWLKLVCSSCRWNQVSDFIISFLSELFFKGRCHANLWNVRATISCLDCCRLICPDYMCEDLVKWIMSTANKTMKMKYIGWINQTKAN